MEQQHLRGHLRELRGRVAFLRSLRPDSASYKLWLGDLIELVNTVWGSDSEQMEQITAILRRERAPGEDLSAEQRYLERLGGLDRLLGDLERDAS